MPGPAAPIIAAAATAISVGRNWSRAVLGAALSWAVGLAVLLAMAILAPNAPVFVFQVVPAVTSVALVGTTLFLYARRGAPKRVLDRKLDRLPPRMSGPACRWSWPWRSRCRLVTLPGPTSPPATWVPQLTFGKPLQAPVGWHVSKETEYDWVRRLYGQHATLIRQQMVADTGNPKWDKFGRPRAVIVDSTNTLQPFSLGVYPSTLLYDTASSRLSDPRPVDLGHGVAGDMYSVIDDQLLVTWNLLVFHWRKKGSAQRVLIGAVDNHEAEAPFPEPNGASWPTRERCSPCCSAATR